MTILHLATGLFNPNFNGASGTSIDLSEDDVLAFVRCKVFNMAVGVTLSL